MKKIFFMISIFSFSAGSLFATETITVATASNFSSPVKKIAALFSSRNPEIAVSIVTGASGKLTTQIENGAPFDVLLSADRQYCEKLAKEKLTAGDPYIFAYGILILFSVHENIFFSGPSALSNTSVKKIVLANPKLAPYGTAAVSFLSSTGLLSQLEPKLVYAENVSQAAQFALSAADAGFIAKSALMDASFDKYRNKKFWIEIDSRTYPPLEHTAVILKRAEKKEAASSFFKFLQSEQAQEILSKYGYISRVSP